ncbi:Coenzyme A biosynthesis bifunctional protein CoaBC [Desulfovibrionales bacterium]
MKTHLTFTGLHNRRLHLGVTGSAAAYKALELVRQWVGTGAHVGVTLTRATQAFITPLAFTVLGADPVHYVMFDPLACFAHLYPGQQAEAFVIAPATANILAALANGLTNDLLSCQALSFSRPIVLAPAMNQKMWEASQTRANVARLRELGHIFVGPDVGFLACGEMGEGRLARLEHIHLHGLRMLCPQDLAGQRLLLTLGPTHEPWDAARHWTNPSSGRMGAALAVVAWLRGATVTAICGPCDLWLPPEIDRRDVHTAKDMDEAAQDLWPCMDIGCLTAAVADFSPVSYGPNKFKKYSLAEEFSISFVVNPDILKRLGVRKRADQLLVGFAAETDRIEEHAAYKLAAKRCDLLVANSIIELGVGFQSATNRVLVLDRNGRQEAWPLLPKTEVAWRIWDWLVTL